MSYWPIILGMVAVTYTTRLSFIAFFGRMEVPPFIQRALRYVPPAVLSAIIFPELLMPGGTLAISFGNARLLAGILATLIAWRTRNFFLTIAAGMAALWILNAVIH